MQLGEAEALLAAAELRAAAAEREACARLVCELCALGDEPIFDPRRGREEAAHALRSSIRAAFNMEGLAAGEAMLAGDPDGVRRADAAKASHRKRCLVCRAASEDLCRSLGAAAAVDRFLEHRRSCGGACRARKGHAPTLCAVGLRLRETMRREACIGGRHVRLGEELDQVAEHFDYPDEYFHVDASGESFRCAATAIRLRGPWNPRIPGLPPCAT